MSNEEKPIVTPEPSGLTPERTRSRRGFLKWGVIGGLAAMSVAMLFLRKKKELAKIHEIMFQRPKDVELGVFHPENVEERKKLSMTSPICGDIMIDSIHFVSEYENSYTVSTKVSFISEPPNPRKQYTLELIAYDRSGSGIAYACEKTADKRTIDLNKEHRESKLPLYQYFVLLPQCVIDFSVDRQTFDKIDSISFFCTESFG